MERNGVPIPLNDFSFPIPTNPYKVYIRRRRIPLLPFHLPFRERQSDDGHFVSFAFDMEGGMDAFRGVLEARDFSRMEVLQLSLRNRLYKEIDCMLRCLGGVLFPNLRYVFIECNDVMLM